MGDTAEKAQRRQTAKDNHQPFCQKPRAMPNSSKGSE
jgi:hypothetical protein